MKYFLNVLYKMKDIIYYKCIYIILNAIRMYVINWGTENIKNLFGFTNLGTLRP